MARIYKKFERDKGKLLLNFEEVDGEIRVASVDEEGNRIAILFYINEDGLTRVPFVNSNANIAIEDARAKVKILS